MEPVLVFETAEGRRGIRAGFPSIDHALLWLACIAGTPNFCNVERCYEVRSGVCSEATLAKVTLPVQAGTSRRAV